MRSEDVEASLLKRRRHAVGHRHGAQTNEIPLTIFLFIDDHRMVRTIALIIIAG